MQWELIEGYRFEKRSSMGLLGTIKVYRVGKRSSRGLNEQKGLGREAAEALYEVTGWKRSRKSLVRG